jgi:deoxyadenosine/deoxycytidine kinase
MGSCQLVGPEGQIVGHLEVQVEQMVDRINKKVAVLEIGEQQKVDENTQEYSRFFPLFPACPVDQVTQVIIGKGGEDKDQEEESRSLPVKEQACKEKECVPECPVAVNARVDQKHYRIKTPEE